ncbi:MAG: 4Fe-4S dicluster domain-containing protein [Methylococcaceae bacterium]|jgi:hypothetical protein
MDTQLDWSAYENYGSGDAFAQVPVAGGPYGKAAAVCIGNRQCQRTEQGVMCPSFRIGQNPVHSTHHRAKTLKAALNGDYGNQPFIGPEILEAMDLCVGCKGCKRECPNGVDMASLRVEALAQRWQTLGKVPLREQLIARLPRYLAASPLLIRGLSALRKRLPGLAQLGERWLGIAAQRALPDIAKHSFLASQTARIMGAADGTEVALLIDTFSNHFSPEVAQAALELLVAGGYRVHLVQALEGQRPLCCGRTFLSNGLVKEAREEALRTVAAVLPYAQKNIPVIGLEPSCLLMLRDEYYTLELGPEVPKIAKSALLLEEFLAREHDAKQLKLSFKLAPDTHAVIHGHCHQKAFGAMKPMRKLLNLVNGLSSEFIESSCCGMAGAFGYEAEHYQASLQMAELSLLPSVRAAKPETLVIANGTSCRQQIQDGTQRDGLHLAQVLRAALDLPSA